MTVLDAIELFEIEMKNEILHSEASDMLEDSLLKAVDSVCATIKETYEATKNTK